MEGETMLSVEKAKSDTNKIISSFDLAISEAETATPRQRRSPTDGQPSSGRLSTRDSKVREGGSLSTASLLTLFDEAIHSSLNGVQASPSPRYSSTSATITATATATATGSCPSLGEAWVKALDSPSDGLFKKSENSRAQAHEGKEALARRNGNHDGSKHHDMEASLDPYLSRPIGGRKATSPADAAAAAHAPAGDVGVNHKFDRRASSNSTSAARCLESPPDSPAKHSNVGSESVAAKDAGVGPGLPDATDGTSMPDTTLDDKAVKDISIPLFQTTSPDDSTSSLTEVVTKPRPEEGDEKWKRDADGVDSKMDTRPSENDDVVVSTQPSTVEAVISSFLEGEADEGEEENKERPLSTITEMAPKGESRRNSEGLPNPPRLSTSSARRSNSISHDGRENLSVDVEISQFASRPSMSASRPSMQKRHSGSYTPSRPSFTKSSGSPIQSVGPRNKEGQRKISISSETGSYIGSLVDSKAASFNVSRLKSASSVVLNLLRGRSRLGTEVTTGSKSWTFVNSLVEGIQYCVERELASGRQANGVLGDESFRQATKDHLESKEGVGFKFKDYCPSVFRKLRHIFGVDDKSYLASICEDGVSEISTAETGSKSGQKFLISSDGRYFMKTCTRDEARFFLKHLEGYHNHVCSNKDTLLCRFFGVHRVKVEGKKLHLLVLGNVFDTDRVVNHRYDLKGSRVGRQADLEDREKPTAILKDLDYDELRGKKSMLVGPIRKKILMKQIRADCDFLVRIKCMDYSMLVGIHKRGNNAGGFNRLMSSTSNKSQIKNKAIGSFGLVKTGSLSTVRREDSHISQFQEHDGGWSSVTEKNGEKVTGDEIYLMGIIDFLQFYNKRKRAETFFKGFKHNRSEISAVHPKLYASRFVAYMDSIMA